MLETIGQTVNVPKLSVTHLRKAAEKIIHQNVKMKIKTKEINAHSQAVGHNYYLPSKGQAKAEFVNHVECEIESPQKKVKVDEDFDLERNNRKRSLEKEDEIARVKKASEFLDNVREDKRERRKNKNRNKVTEKDKQFLQELLLKEMFQDKIQHFPEGKITIGLNNCIIILRYLLEGGVWKKQWNRFIDSYSGDKENHKELLAIETRIFESVVDEIEEEMNEWKGTKDQNRKADEKISSYLRKAFEMYERGFARRGHFFIFKRL